MDLLITTLLIVFLFVLLGSGLWIGLSLLGVAWIGMELFTVRPAGDAMAVTIWGSLSSWTLTALPLFVWMGEILFRTRLSEDMFKGLAPWLSRIPGRLLHTNIIGCTIFAAVSGSSAATCATIGKMTLPGGSQKGVAIPRRRSTIGTLARARERSGLLIPPSIIMIVYGVAAEVSITRLFIAGVIPGLLLAGLLHGVHHRLVAHPSGEDPAARYREMTFREKVYESRHLIPVVALIAIVLGSIYVGIATRATEAAAPGVDRRAAVFHVIQGSHEPRRCSRQASAGSDAALTAHGIAFILAGASFLTLSMGYIGLPRRLAEFIAGLGLSQLGLLFWLMVFYIILGCFLDGISMVVLTMGVILPTIVKAQIDLVWFGIFIVLVVEMAQVTPPVGFNLFVLQGMTKREIQHGSRRSRLPIFLLMVVAVGADLFLPRDRDVASGGAHERSRATCVKNSGFPCYPPEEADGMSNDKTVVDAFLDTVMSQLESGDPPRDQGDATIAFMARGPFHATRPCRSSPQTLRAEMNRMMSEGTPFDNDRYADLLAKIKAEG